MTKSRRQHNSNTASVVETKSLVAIKDKTGNLYESIAIIAKRSNQINIAMKEELHNKFPVLSFMATRLLVSTTLAVFELCCLLDLVIFCIFII